MKRYISKAFLNSIFTDEWPVNNVQLITVVGKRNIFLTHLYYNDGIGYCTSFARNEILNALYTGMNRYELFV